mgnify:CR=1 FL=1
MKKMTCRQLGGACDAEFIAESFDEMARLSQQHSMIKMQEKDVPHLEAANAMRALMVDKEKMEAWMTEKKQAFHSQEDI